MENIYNLIQNEKRSLTKKFQADIRKLANPGFILKKIRNQMWVFGLIASELLWRYPDLVIGIWQRWKQMNQLYLGNMRYSAAIRWMDILHGK